MSTATAKPPARKSPPVSDAPFPEPTNLDSSLSARPLATVAAIPAPTPVVIVVDEDLDRPRDFQVAAVGSAIVGSCYRIFGKREVFVFQRSEADGKVFTTVAEVVLDGSSMGDAKFEDKTVTPGHAYFYRVTQKIGDRYSRFASPLRVVANGQKRTGSVLDAINDQRDAAAKAEREYHIENKAAALRTYVEILLRVTEPQPGDVEQIEELLADKRMGFTESRLTRDAELVKEVRRHRATAKAYPPSDPQKLAALRAAEKAAEKALRDAEHAVSQYVRGVGMGQNARRELKRLAEVHAELFEPVAPGEQPRFLTEEQV